MWIAAVIQGHRDPFGKNLRDYTAVELDFVLEMAAKDDPDRWVFLRNGEDTRMEVAEARAGWASVLAGAMLHRYREATGAARGDRNIAAWRARQAGGRRPGITRGGKAIGDAGNPDHRT